MLTRIKRRRSRGFTLIEVLLVLAILVILASMVGVYFVGAPPGADEKASKAQIGMFKQQLDMFRLDVGSYPSGTQGLSALRNRPADLRQPQKWKGPYSEKDIPLDPWDNPYQYELLNADQFHIWSLGPDQQDGNDDDISNL